VPDRDALLFRPLAKHPGVFRPVDDALRWCGVALAVMQIFSIVPYSAATLTELPAPIAISIAALGAVFHATALVAAIVVMRIGIAARESTGGSVDTLVYGLQLQAL
jgi:hypothetical protein